MHYSWKKWAERRGNLSNEEAVEGLRELSLAYREIDETTRIPLMTRMRPLPEIVRLMLSAEFSNTPEQIADLCHKLKSAPTDLRQGVMTLRATLLPPPAPHAGPLGFYINLDERGAFYADLRDENEESLYEIHSEDDGSISLIEDGFMRHKEDLDGLQAYLVDMGMIDSCAEVLPASEFEDRLSSPQMEM
jgi:hypothetical protein